jgi:nicotinate-nucleotide adenylyltransferase
MGTVLFFGGTFNPPHIAHRKMLEAISQLPEIDRVLVAPTNIPPHKEVPGMFATKEQRLYMCELLCEGVNKAEVSDIEFKREGKSYSFYTLSELKEQYGSVAMLIGGDMVTSFTTWHRYEELLNIAAFYVVRRKGIDNTDFDRSVELLKSKGGNIKVLELDFPEVSSTEIRDAFINNQSVEKLVPENIARFISQNGLYRKA